MSRKEKHNVRMKRSDKSRGRARDDTGGYVWWMDKKIMICLVVLLIVAVFGFYKTLTKIDDVIKLQEAGSTEDGATKLEAKLSDEQAKNMPLNDAELNSDSSIKEILIYPAELDGKLFSGYAVVSFDTSDGPYALYDGYFEEGLFNGQGTYTRYYAGTTIVGSIYDGEWKDSLPNGVGTSKSFYENGSMKDLGSGDWKDGQLSGPSCGYTCYWPTGKVHYRYSGGMLDGKNSGSGEYVEFSSTGGLAIECFGDYLDNELNGNGRVLEYAEDGETLKCVHEGTWKNGNLETGREEYYYEDGKAIKYLFEGIWGDHGPEGQGAATEYYEDGKSIKWQHSSLWKDGFPDGEGVFTKYDKNGKIMTTGKTECTMNGTDINLTTVWDTSTADEAAMNEFTNFINDIIELSGHRQKGE